MALTTNGIAAQILSCLVCYKHQQFVQSENDCKVALNRLIRAFGEAMKIQIFVSNEAEIHDGKFIKDHVIPVKVLMKELLKKNAYTSLDESNHKKLMEFLTKNLVIAKITQREDQLLTDKSLHDSMPKDWNGKNVWARYDMAKIKISKK